MHPKTPTFVAQKMRVEETAQFFALRKSVNRYKKNEREAASASQVHTC